MTSDTAQAAGLHDRGVLAVGKKADVNVIDWDRLGCDKPYVVHDLPAGGKRLMQKVHGYDATIVSGRITYREGQATGELPGRLVRGQQAELGRVTPATIRPRPAAPCRWSPSSWVTAAITVCATSSA